MGGTLAFVLLVKVSVTIFMKLDTHHILKLLSSEHVTTFKRKLGILVTKLKLQVNVFKFCHLSTSGVNFIFFSQRITKMDDHCPTYQARSDE